MTRATIKIEIPAGDVSLVTRVFVLQDCEFLPKDAMRFDQATATYTIEIEGEHVLHLLELIESGADMPNAETFSERRVRLGRQTELPLGDAEEVVYATGMSWDRH